MEELLQAAGGESQQLAAKALVVIPRLLLALVLGSVIAWRPWKRTMRPRDDMVQTQILMCVAGALIASVIGDSLARAFGLVGLGGFIRFRSGLKDPRDAASLFVLIGLGMACGMGAAPIALAGWCFVVPLFAALDRYAERKNGSYGRWRLTLEARELEEVEAACTQALLAKGCAPFRRSVHPSIGKVVLEVDAPEGVVEGLRVPWEKATAVHWERINEVEQVALHGKAAS